MLITVLLLGHVLATAQASASLTNEGEVVASRVINQCEQGVHENSNCRDMLHIEMLLNGERLQLVSDTSWRRKLTNNLLPLGVYKVRTLKDERPTTYMRHSRYELQYADGKTEQFDLEGVEAISR